MKQFRVEAFGGFFAGHLDGLIRIDGEWHVLEVKTANQKSFNSTCKHGVQKDKETHWVQMQIYVGFASHFWDRWGIDGDPPTKALYWVVCKNSEDFYLELVEFDKEAFETYGELARRIILDPNTPERISGPGKWPCSWCDFHGLCWERSLPKPACKNCAQATPNMETRKWDCARHQIELDRDAVLTKCANHVYQPGFFPDLAVVEMDEEHDPPRWIQYEDGTKNHDNSEELFEASKLWGTDFDFA